MKKIILILATFVLTSCSATNMTENIKDKMKNIGKNPCWNEEKKAVIIGCKK